MDILLVDDNLLMQQVLERFLGSLGYVVTPAARADEAVEQARKRRPALILMDLHLPDCDGADAIKLIRALPGCQYVPAIAMSGMDALDAGSLITSDFSMYLSKPIDLDEFELAVRNVLSSHTPSADSAQ
ncbi:MAG: response regulator [Roseiflexaceae bacterium]|nr:response regulator [Roseiflexaceae bacterium]